MNYTHILISITLGFLILFLLGLIISTNSIISIFSLLGMLSLGFILYKVVGELKI